MALDEFDMELVAQLREHTRIPGMGTTAMAYYRDKLAMRMGAREAGFLVPEFVRVLNYDELRDYMARVPAPWLLKPRADIMMSERHACRVQCARWPPVALVLGVVVPI